MAQRPLYEIGNTGSSIHNTDVELNVLVSDTHFRIDFFTANFEGNPTLLKQYLHHVKSTDLEYIPPLPEILTTSSSIPLKSSMNGRRNHFYRCSAKYLP